MTRLEHPVLRIVAVRTLQASVLGLAAHWLLHWPLVGPHALGFVFTPLLCLYFVFVFVARWSWGLPILTRLPTREPVVALTFDDGPSPLTTPAVLEALARHQAQATFFVLGEQARRYPGLIRRIQQAGHTIGIHAETHEAFVLLSGSKIDAQICCTRDAVQQAGPDATECEWLRPPYGFKTLTLVWLAQRMGCRLVTWSVDSRDYRGLDAPAIAHQVLAHLQPGAIILLHDGAANRATADALPEILDGLAQRGYRAVGLACGADR